MTTVFDLYVDGVLRCTLSESQAKRERKRIGHLKGITFRQRFVAPSKSRQSEVAA